MNKAVYNTWGDREAVGWNIATTGQNLVIILLSIIKVIKAEADTILTKLKFNSFKS